MPGDSAAPRDIRAGGTGPGADRPGGRAAAHAWQRAQASEGMCLYSNLDTGQRAAGRQTGPTRQHGRGDRELRVLPVLRPRRLQLRARGPGAHSRRLRRQSQKRRRGNISRPGLCPSATKAPGHAALQGLSAIR